MSTINVKPAPNILLRDPVTKRLMSAAPVEGIDTFVVPAAGLPVDVNDLWWARRLRDGDAVLVAAPDAQSKTASKSTTSGS